MEYDYSAIPTTKVDEVAISISDAPPSPTAKPPLDDDCIVIDLVYSTTLYYLILLSGIVGEKQLPFKINRVLMIASIVSQFVALASAVTLVYAQKYLQSSIIDRYNSMLKIISIFSAVMAFIFITVVCFIPQNLTWIGYLVIISLIVVIGVTCYYFKKDVWESKVLQPRHETNHYSVVTITYFLMVLCLFIPMEFIWTRFPIALVIVAIAFVYTCVKVINEGETCM